MGGLWLSGLGSVVEAFTAGVNAYVAEVGAGKRPLPVEFKLTASKPEMWGLEDVLRIRSHALVSNVTSEVARARVACAAVDCSLIAFAASWSQRTQRSSHQGSIPAWFRRMS